MGKKRLNQSYRYKGEHPKNAQTGRGNICILSSFLTTKKTLSTDRRTFAVTVSLNQVTIYNKNHVSVVWTYQFERMDLPEQSMAFLMSDFMSYYFVNRFYLYKSS